MIEGLLLPELDADSAPFWDGCAEGELRVQACSSCGRLRFPPRPMCPSCQSFEHEWRAMSGRGRVWSFVVAHPPLLPAYAEMAPYNVIVVELDDDPSIRMVGNLVTRPDGELGEVDPASIEIGESVAVVFAAVAEGAAVPRWVRPA